MKPKLFGAIALLALCGSASAGNGWVSLGDWEGSKESINEDTLNLYRNKVGDTIVSAVGSVASEDGTVTYFRWYLPTADCDAGHGKLVARDKEGDVLYQTDFTVGSDSDRMTGSRAAILCSFYKTAKAKLESEGQKHQSSSKR